MLTRKGGVAWFKIVDFSKRLSVEESSTIISEYGWPYLFRQSTETLFVNSLPAFIAEHTTLRDFFTGLETSKNNGKKLSSTCI
jgi:hypothetical protein